MHLGAKLPYFELIGCDDQQHSLVDIADRSCVLVIFICNHCPYVQAYLPRIKALIDRYYEDNLGVILINSNDAAQQPTDSFDHMKNSPPNTAGKICIGTTKNRKWLNYLMPNVHQRPFYLTPRENWFTTAELTIPGKTHTM